MQFVRGCLNKENILSATDWHTWIQQALHVSREEGARITGLSYITRNPYVLCHQVICFLTLRSRNYGESYSEKKKKSCSRHYRKRCLCLLTYAKWFPHLLWKASSVFVGGDYPDTLPACCHAVKLYMVMTFDLIRTHKQYLDFRLVIMICSKS